MDRDLFSLVAARLEARTDLDRLEARGTLRIALKKGGVDPTSFTRKELEAIVAGILPSELAQRGASDPDGICNALLRSLPSDLSGDLRDTAASRDEIMRRLASG